MAKIQFVVPDADRDLFVSQAKREGMSLSAWLRAAAHDRSKRNQKGGRFRSAADVEAFFRWCDTLDGPPVEPDWEEHLETINRSRQSGSSGT